MSIIIIAFSVAIINNLPNFLFPSSLPFSAVCLVFESNEIKMAMSWNQQIFVNFGKAAETATATTTITTTAMK